MNIAAIEKLSLLDYPKKLSGIVFTQGCNYDCFYCHNRSLIGWSQTHPSPNYKEFLTERVGKLEGILISGGEPTLQRALLPFVRECKALGYLVKLDTNGSHPVHLKELLDDNLVDYVALDVKAVWSDYKWVCGAGGAWQAVNDSLELLKGSTLEWEVRTTLYPTMTLTDLATISQQIGEVPLWRLNIYREPINYKEGDKFRIKAPSLQREEVAEWLKSYGGKVIISG